MTSDQSIGTSYPGFTPEPHPEAPSSSDSSSAGSSTTEVAKQQASEVAQNAGESARHVAGVAKDQAGEVMGEAKQQAQQVLHQARSEVMGQAGQQQQRAAEGLRTVADQLQAMADGSEQSGTVTDLARQAADKTHEFAGWLENRDPGAVLDEVRSFARRRPGLFLVIALGAGVVAGRLARGMTSDAADGGDASNASGEGAATQDHARALAGGPPALAGGQDAFPTDVGHGATQTYGSVADDPYPGSAIGSPTSGSGVAGSTEAPALSDSWGERQ